MYISESCDVSTYRCSYQLCLWTNSSLTQLRTRFIKLSPAIRYNVRSNGLGASSESAGRLRQQQNRVSECWAVRMIPDTVLEEERP